RRSALHPTAIATAIQSATSCFAASRKNAGIRSLAHAALAGAVGARMRADAARQAGIAATAGTVLTGAVMTHVVGAARPPDVATRGDAGADHPDVLRPQGVPHGARSPVAPAAIG